MRPDLVEPVRVSVVIPAFNAAAHLAEQLEAVCRQELAEPFEIVVADNGSTDGTVEMVRRYADQDRRICLVDASARRGPAAARNAGVRAARGASVLFCDADDVVAEGWLHALSAPLSDAAIVVGALDVTSLNRRPAAPPVDPWPRQFGFLPAGLGANMAVDRDAFEAVGGFDEDLGVGEDLDLCWRLQLAGYRLERAMGAVVAKRGRPVGLDLLAQSLAYGRSDAVLYRRFRAHGMPRGLLYTLKAWAWLVVNAPAVRRPERRRDWLRVLFIRVGRLVGCVEQRVLYP